MEPVGSASVAGVTSPHLVCAPEAASLLHLLDPGRVHAPLHLSPVPRSAERGSGPDENNRPQINGMACKCLEGGRECSFDSVALLL